MLFWYCLYLSTFGFRILSTYRWYTFVVDGVSRLRVYAYTKFFGEVYKIYHFFERFGKAFFRQFCGEEKKT